ncbi:MAG TPA: NAD(+) synthase [Gemmataceae bacterium]|nr:NAD(+) synthase [Gemmataceae bacterium]
MLQHGFIRVAAAVPRLRVADCAFNAAQLTPILDQAEEQLVHILAFPELALTGYTCGDLFHQPSLQTAALDALADLLAESEMRYAGLFVVGLPWLVGDQLYNVAAVCQKGRLLGVVPKSYLPNYKEFYEGRWFTPGTRKHEDHLPFQGSPYIPFGTDLLFVDESNPRVVVGVEICEDLWTPIPPSCYQALAGARILVNLSASNEVIGKAVYRRQLVASQSGRCIAGYVYACSGVSESTTDLVFGGHAIIAENGNVLAEATRFERNSTLIVTDIDLQRLGNDRQRMNSFNDSLAHMRDHGFLRIPFHLEKTPTRLIRAIDAHPFVPTTSEQLAERCSEIFHAQVAGLAKRLEHLNQPAVAIGVSGGLDSTLALLVACKTFDTLKTQRTKIQALTMPGFGTTARTRGNACALMQHLGVSAREVDIRGLCLEEMRALGHRPFGIALDGLDVDAFVAKLHDVPADARNDLVFENVQARMRTSLLMNTAFVVGTGDLSEYALGWCTYNGDHISMYAPNVSIPKTLVKFLVRWAAENEFEGSARSTLLDIVATEISPELLPTARDGQVTQSTESVIGPYELVDFFLFHFLRYGAPPEKILFLAEHAKFDQSYSSDELRRWLKVFIQRFFANQFKRSCLPDGPKVGTISLSPRGDWRMPSDAEASAWLAFLSPSTSDTR